VVLIGTTTPNCIRTTAYDANYNVIVLEDATSAQTEEIQRGNLQDMERMETSVFYYNFWL
jgi:nicotinamidase-related amidase